MLKKLKALDGLSAVVLMENNSSGVRIIGKWGLSILVTARHEGVVQNILFDVGADPDALLCNMQELGVDPNCVDMIVMSHSHFDHSLGLARVVAAIGKRGLPVVAHPAMTRVSFYPR
jgi:7,8-dihydropterin-6-yl-methyl-4-(beta-D-ribofuranosyl)aminobenzene 5'-phosphate synthase